MKLTEARILVVDDNQELCSLVENICRQEGFSHVETAFSCREAESRIKSGDVDFLILDVNLPFEDGFSFLQRIKTVLENQRIPVLFLSARDQDEDRLQGLDLGADDYMTKPFSPSELVARVKSQLRRYTRLGAAIPVENAHIYETGGLSINDDLKEVRVDGDVVKLTPIEYNILFLLMKNQGRVFSINQIYENIWNEEAVAADNTVAVHIRHIREKIEINPREPRYLKVVWGLGYKVEKI